VDLAPHYSRFRVTERILLTGHSHQAWPDVSFDAQQRAWLDAASPGRRQVGAGGGSG
jgi:kynureninase